MRDRRHARLNNIIDCASVFGWNCPPLNTYKSWKDSLATRQESMLICGSGYPVWEWVTMFVCDSENNSNHTCTCI